MRTKKVVCVERFSGFVPVEHAYTLLNQRIVEMGALPDPDTFRYDREFEYIDTMSNNDISLSYDYTRASLESFGE